MLELSEIAKQQQKQIDEQHQKIDNQAIYCYVIEPN